MNTHRIALAVGAAGGGLLASAFLSTAVAFATTPTESASDTLSLFNPTSTPETVVAVNGMPPLFQDISGNQAFTINDVTAQGTSTTPVDVGTMSAQDSTFTLGSMSSTEYTVTAATAALSNGSAFTQALPEPGSVYDVLNLGGASSVGAGLQNVYSDVLAGTGTTATSTVTDHLLFNGTMIADLTPLFSGVDMAVPATDLLTLF